MNIRDLKYLVALAEYEHFGKAAEACFVSQPALSMQIKKLEETLGVTLLERTNKSVLLTDSGAIIAKRARHILSEVEEIREIAKSAHDPFSGELKIGIFPTLAPYLLPIIIPKLSKKFPNISFYLIEEKTNSLIEQLKLGKLHAAFLASPVSESGLKSTPLFEEEFLLAVATSNPLSHHKSVKQQDLQHKNLLLLDEGHCMRDQALALCHRMKAAETQNFRATSLETLRNMVTANVGITLMPKLACHKNDGVCYIPFSNPKPSRSIELFWRTTSAKKIVLQAIGKEIQTILAKNNAVTLIN